MMTFMAIMVFGGSVSVAGYALFATVAPQWWRIADVLRGERPSSRFEPLSALVRAERHIAVRRWSAASPARMPASLRSREAA